jgi:hypothetical protein
VVLEVISLAGVMRIEMLGAELTLRIPKTAIRKGLNPQ